MIVSLAIRECNAHCLFIVLVPAVAVSALGRIEIFFLSFFFLLLLNETAMQMLVGVIFDI